ncbi:MAG: hypothetical protein LBQ66_06960 [Planctomycetaceae bacterium]|jgi:fructose-specific phosphotransferase system component IIB|nr:hypothetical protein [Planctomycetaceae bacterium]
MKIVLSIYGATGSGKTSFFRQLIQGNFAQIASNQKLTRFLSNSISPSGQILPTTSGIERLDIKFGRDSYVISDLKGELLSAAAAELDVERTGYFGGSNNLLAKQIAKSDAVLFFFDPTAQSTAASIRPQDFIQNYHNEELLRAKQIIKFTLKKRENNLTPILFILTHNDIIATDPKLNELTENWINEVNKFLQKTYTEILDGYYPDMLICKERLFYRVTTLRNVKPSVLPAGSAPQGKVDAVNWIESFPFATELANILLQTKSQLELIKNFYRNDRKRYRSVVIFFAICFCIVFFVPLICMTSKTTQSLINNLRERITKISENLPELPSILNSEVSSISNAAINLKPLTDISGLDDRSAAVVNRSLYILMKRMNKLEDENKTQTSDYQKLNAQWTDALTEIDKKFDNDRFDDGRTKLNLFGRLLSGLTDSTLRITPPLRRVLSKYWIFYRAVLVNELAGEIQINRDAGSNNRQLLETLSMNLEHVFHEISDSNIRGESQYSNPAQKYNANNESNLKEKLKQDIRKSYISCRNFLDGYHVEIRFREINYNSEIGINRDYKRRLKITTNDSPISNKTENKNEKINQEHTTYVDLTISPGYKNDKNCQFTPMKDNVTILLKIDSNIHVTLQQSAKYQTANNTPDADAKTTTDTAINTNDSDSKKKTTDSIKDNDWEDQFVWKIIPKQNETKNDKNKINKNNSASLDIFGIKFYLQHENDDNTTYSCNASGMKIQFTLNRTKIVPEFLWEIVKQIQ